MRGKGFAGGRATYAALAWDSLEQWCVGGVERKDVDSSGQTTVSEVNAKWTAVAAAFERLETGKMRYRGVLLREKESPAAR